MRAAKLMHGKPMHATIWRAALAIALAACSGVTHALQVLDASDGVAVEAVLSIQEPTRIRIEGAPITDVFGNIYASSCTSPQGLPAVPGNGVAVPAAAPVNPAGEIVLECDRDKGEIYIRPVGDSGKPVNLFVSSAHGTYTLLLRRADTPADTIVIRDKAAIQRRTEVAGPRTGTGAAASHVRSLKALLVAMATDRIPPDLQVEDLDQPITLWREARFRLERTFRGRGLIGERYQIQNLSGEVMVLAEPEFDREDDEGGGVAAIAVEHHNLRPGERTQVFVIRREARP